MDQLQEGRDQRGVPVVRVHDVGPEVQRASRLERRGREEGEALVVAVLGVHGAVALVRALGPVVMLGMIDEDHVHAVDIGPQKPAVS